MQVEEKKRRSLRTLALASFFNDLGSDIIYPVWPLFITVTLRANKTVLGFLDGLGEALVSISQAVSGFLSDRWGKRKVFIWVGYLCGGMSRLGYALASAWTLVVPFRVLDRAGKIRSAPRDALVADLTAEADRGRAFGLLRTMDHAGALAGILVCLVLVNLVGYRLLFALAAVPSFVSVILILAFIRDRPEGRGRAYKGIAFGSLSLDFRMYLLSGALFSLGAFSTSFLLLRAGDAGFRAGFVPVLYLLYTAAASAFSLPFGRLSDRLGRKTVLFLAMGVWGAVCLGMALARDLIFIAAIFPVFGLHKAALEPVQKTLVCDLAPAPHRASYLGTYQMIIGLCALPASLTAGLLWDRFGPTAPFALSLLLTACSAVVLAFVREKAPGTPPGCSP